MKHTMDVPDKLWKLAQQKYGVKNPAPNLRDELWGVFTRSDDILAEIREAQERFTEVLANATEYDDLRARKAYLDCLPNPLDKDFTAAWAWAAREFGSETLLVQHLERQVSLPKGAMGNPRAVIIARWRDAGSPYVVFS